MVIIQVVLKTVAMTQKYLKKPEDIRTREQIHQNAILP